MTVSSAQTTNDINEILAMTKLYFDGLYSDDIEQLKSIFHDEVVLKAPNLRRSRDEWLQAVASRPVPRQENEDYRFRVISVEVIHDQAMVKVECPLFENFYIDYLGFLKENDKWLIVNKMYTAIST